MKLNLIILSLFVSTQALCSRVMPNVNTNIFINEGRTDYDSVLIRDEEFVKFEVKLMFDNDLLNHPKTKAFDNKANFESYWETFRYHWRRCDLNKDDRFELFFSGVINWEDSTEVFEIYVLKDVDYELVYGHNGRLVAYKIQPFTKEIILFHHQYPCCSNASHFINTVRLIGEKINLRKKYFLARDGDMKGNFFPEAVAWEDDYSYTEKKVKLYWSDKILRRAWKKNLPNVITRYQSNIPYKVLSIKDGMMYVLFSGTPMLEDNKVINPANFDNVKIFGWIKET